MTWVKGRETPAHCLTLLNKVINTIGQFIFIFCDQCQQEWKAWPVISYRVMQGDSSSGNKEHEIGVFSGTDRGLVMNVWGALVSLLSVSALRAEWLFLADLQCPFRGYAWEWGLSAAPSFQYLHWFLSFSFSWRHNSPAVFLFQLKNNTSKNVAYQKPR